MQSSKFGMKKLHLFLQKRAFTARAMIKYLSIYMHLIIFSSFANSSTDITHFKGVGSDVVSVSCFGVRFSVMFHLCLFIILLVQFGFLSGHLLGNSCPLG